MRFMQVSKIVLLVALAVSACSEHKDAPAKAPTPVRVRLVEQRAPQTGARYSGNIEPGTRVDLAFKVGGYVRDIVSTKTADNKEHRLQEGDWVKAGTVLAHVRESDYEQRIGAASAALAEANAAQAQAKLELDRSTKLFEGGSTAKAEVDAQKTRFDAASARADGAKSRVMEAQLALGDTALRAPIDGVVLKRAIEVGSLVGPGSLAFVVADTRSVKAVFGVPDVVVEKLKMGSELLITTESVAGEFKGTITRVSPSADPKSRVFDVEATIPNPKDQLKVGMIAALKVPEGALAQTSVVLPLTAVIRSPRDPRGFSVYVVEDAGGQSVARVKDVKLGDVVGNMVYVREGLDLGLRVVSMGATLLHDGEAVHVIP